MKLLRHSRYLMVLLASLASACASADTVSAEQLVKRLYAFHSRQFERGEFAGKFDPARQCKLFRDFFVEPMMGRQRYDRPGRLWTVRGQKRAVAGDRYWVPLDPRQSRHAINQFLGLRSG